MKRTVAFLLAVTLMFGLCACGKEAPKDDTNKGGDTTVTTTTTTEAESTITTTTEGTEAPTTEGTEAPTTTAGDSTTAVVGDPTKAPTTTADKKPTKTEAPATTSGTKKPVTGFIPSIPTTTQRPTTEKPATTTKKPTTTTTTTTEPVDTRPQIKILSIGHSFSIDAMETYMWELFEAAGYNTTIGYLYYPGCALERHYHYIKDNSKKYERYSKNSNGTWKTIYNTNVTKALWDEEWDIVTFQPSPDYGQGKSYKCDWGCNKTITNDYVHFGDIINLVKGYLASDENPNGPNTDVKFYYHLTWAFATDCTLWSFTYSGFDQMRMYNDFLKATKDHVLTNSQIKGFIPCITSVQNARTSWMGDTFNNPGGPNGTGDGYHLNDKGDLVAAMTWVAYFTGKDANSFKIGTKYSDDEYAAIAEAVNNAIKNPDKVTESSYKTEP